MKEINIKNTRCLILLVLTFFITVFPVEGSGQKRKYVNPTGNEFPIVAWSSFRFEKDITEKNFRNLKDAGFNISMALTHLNLAEKSLKIAGPLGIKIMMNTPETKNLQYIPKYVPEFKNNNAVMGYFVADEPTTKQFQNLKEICDLIYKYDPNHLPFINLFPIVDPSIIDAKSYKDYLTDFVKTVGLPVFSFDNYPIIKKNNQIRVKEDFYQNLEIASQVTKETGVPFWAFCLSSSHYSYPTPTLGALQFEAFNALAYGAQGLSYYTYMMEDSKAIKYYDAPVNLQGKTTKVWTLCKNVNTQIRNLTPVFLGATFINAWHTGKTLPKGTNKLTQMPGPFTGIKTGDAGVLVSLLKNKGKNYLVIVSHDPEKNQKVELSKTRQVVRIKSTGQSVIDKSSSYTLGPGGYLIFTW